MTRWGQAGQRRGNHALGRACRAIAAPAGKRGAALSLHAAAVLCSAEMCWGKRGAGHATPSAATAACCRALRRRWTSAAGWAPSQWQVNACRRSGPGACPHPACCTPVRLEGPRCGSVGSALPSHCVRHAPAGMQRTCAEDMQGAACLASPAVASCRAGGGLASGPRAPVHHAVSGAAGLAQKPFRCAVAIALGPPPVPMRAVGTYLREAGFNWSVQPSKLPVPAAANCIVAYHPGRSMANSLAERKLLRRWEAMIDGGSCQAGGARRTLPAPLPAASRGGAAAAPAAPGAAVAAGQQVPIKAHKGVVCTRWLNPNRPRQLPSAANNS